MKYKNYEASIKYSDEDKIFIGEVVNASDILVFDGSTVEEVNASFHVVVDEYLKVVGNKCFAFVRFTNWTPGQARGRRGVGCGTELRVCFE